MVNEQIMDFLSAPRHAILATNRLNGSPQVSPVWYIFENGQLYISTSVQTAKAQNIMRDRRVTVCVDGGRGDSRYVVLSGSVAIVSNGAPAQQAMRWRIIRHYHSNEAAARTYHDATQNESQILLVLAPEKIFGRNFN